MIELSNAKDKCFAELSGGCTVVIAEYITCSPQCPFYKPTGCEDWIRREVNGEIWLIPPEEYVPSAETKKWIGKWKK